KDHFSVMKVEPAIMSEVFRQGTLLVRPWIIERAVVRPTRAGPRSKLSSASDRRRLRVFDPRLAVSEIEIVASPAQRNPEQVRIVADIGFLILSYRDNDPFHRRIFLLWILGEDGPGEKRTTINFRSR